MDILTEAYAQDLYVKYGTSTKPALYKQGEEEPYLTCKYISKERRNWKVELPDNKTKSSSHFEQPVSGLGTIYYLLLALEGAPKFNTLRSSDLGTAVSDSGTKLWERFERLGLARKIKGRSEYFDHYRFTISSSMDLKRLEKDARNRATEIKAQGNIEAAIAKIQARLKSPTAGEILES